MRHLCESGRCQIPHQSSRVESDSMCGRYTIHADTEEIIRRYILGRERVGLRQSMAELHIWIG